MAKFLYRSHCRHDSQQEKGKKRFLHIIFLFINYLYTISRFTSRCKYTQKNVIQATSAKIFLPWWRTGAHGDTPPPLRRRLLRHRLTPYQHPTNTLPTPYQHPPRDCLPHSPVAKKILPLLQKSVPLHQRCHPRAEGKTLSISLRHTREGNIRHKERWQSGRLRRS